MTVVRDDGSGRLLVGSVGGWGVRGVWGLGVIGISRTRCNKFTEWAPDAFESHDGCDDDDGDDGAADKGARNVLVWQYTLLIENFANTSACSGQNVKNTVLDYRSARRSLLGAAYSRCYLASHLVQHTPWFHTPVVCQT
jgi:hypothetical protein